MSASGDVNCSALLAELFMLILSYPSGYGLKYAVFLTISDYNVEVAAALEDWTVQLA